jgi:hypothetical protein
MLPLGLFTKKKNFIFNSEEEKAIIKMIKAVEGNTKYAYMLSPLAYGIS